MATRIYKTPFAATGDREALAAADQPDGNVSLQAGWTPDYELPNDNANYRPVGRAEMNGFFNELTLALGEMQLNGFAKWQSIDGGWPLNGQVLHNGMAYRSTANANVTQPGVIGATWVPMGLGIASTGQAQGQTNDTTLLTPRKPADAFKEGNQAFGASGYQKLPGGLILQWLTVTSTITVNDYALPIPFPVGPLHGWANGQTASDNLTGASVFCEMFFVGNSPVGVKAVRADGSLGARGFSILAIGY